MTTSWNPEMEPRLRELKAAGWTARAIAAELGISYESAKSHARRLCGPQPQGGAAAQRARAAAAGRPAWPPLVEEVRRMYFEQRLSHAQISDHFGVTPASVAGFCHRNGIVHTVRERPSTEAMRKCLCCGRAFRSAHAGNRICENCRGTEIYRGIAA